MQSQNIIKINSRTFVVHNLQISKLGPDNDTDILKSRLNKSFSIPEWNRLNNIKLPRQKLETVLWYSSARIKHEIRLRHSKYSRVSLVLWVRGVRSKRNRKMKNCWQSLQQSSFIKIKIIIIVWYNNNNSNNSMYYDFLFQNSHFNSRRDSWMTFWCLF